MKIFETFKPHEVRFCPFTLMKLDSEVVATALAIMVFPVPGGPYNSSHLGGATSASLNRSACLSGHSMASAILQLQLVPLSRAI